jgi:serine/threonine protein kinase
VFVLVKWWALLVWVVLVVLMCFFLFCMPMAGKGEIDQLSLIFNTLGGPTPSEVKILSKYLNSTNINWSEISTYPCKIASLLEHLDCGSVGGTGGEANVVRNVVDLLKGMLRYDCNARVTAKEAKEHSFFSDEPRATALNCMPMIEM